MELDTSTRLSGQLRGNGQQVEQDSKGLQIQSQAIELVVSPYTTVPHLLDLASIECTDSLMAHALTHLEPVRADYATAPYLHAFNWAAVFRSLQLRSHEDGMLDWEGQFYVVVFRSRVRPNTSLPHLHHLDEQAHAEAMESGGLLKYWFGVPDPNGRNLATCVWRNEHDAARGTQGSAHRQAARETRDLYLEWKIEQLSINVRKGGLEWSITPLG